MPIDITYGLFALIALAGGFMIIYTDNVLYAAIGLLITLLSVAGIFVLSFADFVAVTQIMIYVGGTLTIMIFGIMLSQRNDLSPGKANKPIRAALITLLSIILSFCLLFPLSKVDWQQLESDNKLLDIETTVQPIGKQLMTQYLLPFEIIAVTLLIALVGATYIASKNLKNR